VRRRATVLFTGSLSARPRGLAGRRIESPGPLACGHRTQRRRPSLAIVAADFFLFVPNIVAESCRRDFFSHRGRTMSVLATMMT
jgi:hypothetical protein